MTQLNQVYRCNVCGNITEVLQAGQGQLVCCGENMELLKPKTQDEGKEKHVPVIEKTENGIKVKIGETPHPMEESHFIQWVEVISNGKSYRKHLKPNQSPEAEFCLKSEEIETVREYCNVHGFWADKEE